MEIATRKLVGSGKDAFMVTLPRKELSQYGWKKGDILKLRIDGANLSIVNLTKLYGIE